MKDKKLSTEQVMIYRLISINKLMSDTINSQQQEIVQLGFRIDGLLTWEKNRKKHTNKKYLNRMTPPNSYKAIKEVH